MNRSIYCALFLVLAASAHAAPSRAVLPSASAGLGDPAAICQSAARAALGQCAIGVNQAQIVCHNLTGAPCGDSDTGIVNALAGVDNAVIASCATDQVVQDAGFGPSMTQAALSARLQEACAGNVDTISARVFGGPQAALLGSADAALKDCLIAGANETGQMLGNLINAYGPCIDTHIGGGVCDLAAANAGIASALDNADQLIDAVCPGTLLSDAIGIDVSELVARAAKQAECMVSASYADTTPFVLDCGPGSPPARGVPTQYTIDDLDEARCGDGSAYSFWVELAPADNPVEDVVVYLQGGGVCVLEGQCQGVALGNPGLLTSADDAFPSQGILGDAADNPFAGHTKVYLPYCTQDVFIGGGATQVFNPDLTVERYGGRNVRAALNLARNLIWAELDATTETGYRPDLLNVLFTGSSAGGFGALYNYHWVLDDLRWVNATGAPSASLALDNGQGTGILLIGALVQGLWEARTVQPSYCQTIDCAVGPVLAAVSAQRLGATARQKLLWVSNQVDDVQAGTTNFASTLDWTNAVRTSYCADRGEPNVNYFLSADPASTHSMISSDASLLGLSAAGIPLRTWLAVNGAAQDAVDEGTLVADIPGVAPFDCALVAHDADNDGVANASDNCLLVANPDQRDDDNDGIGTICDADFSQDCQVNVVDLGLMRANFFTSAGSFDLNGDGVVNVIDLGLLKTAFFAPVGPSGVAGNLCGE